MRASPTSGARAERILDRYADSLAALLAEETGASPGDLTPSVVANTLIGFRRAVIDYVRQRIEADPADLRRLARAVQADGQKALELLAEGLAGYGDRPPLAAWPSATQVLVSELPEIVLLAVHRERPPPLTANASRWRIQPVGADAA